MSVRRTLVALVGAVLLLTGCTADAEPRFTPTDSPSPSVSETSAEPEAQTPEEFIREWFELNTEMQNTGETAAFLAVSKSCRPCASLAKRVDRIYSAGGFIRLDTQRVADIDLGSRSATIKQFDVVVITAPTKYRESEDGKLLSYGGGRASYQLTLIREESSWRMDNVLIAG